MEMVVVLSILTMMFLFGLAFVTFIREENRIWKKNCHKTIRLKDPYDPDDPFGFAGQD